MTKIICPHCNRTGSSSKNVPQGAKVKCPGCGKTFLFEAPDPATVGVLPTPTLPLSQAPPVAALPTPPGLAPAANHSVLAPAPVPFQQVIQVTGPEPQRTNPVGVAALVLGILAALIAWVPFLGLLAIPVGLLGALLGAIGLTYGLVTKRGKVTTAGIGLGLSLGSVLLSVAMTGMAANRVSNALEEAERKANKSARPAVETTNAVPQPRSKPRKLSPGANPTKQWSSLKVPLPLRSNRGYPPTSPVS